MVNSVSDANSLPNPDGFATSPGCNYFDTNRHTVGHPNRDTAEINSRDTLPLVHQACSRIYSLPQSGMIR